MKKEAISIYFFLSHSSSQHIYRSLDQCIRSAGVYLLSEENEMDSNKVSRKRNHKQKGKKKKNTCKYLFIRIDNQ
jgi:hypothetical protein